MVRDYEKLINAGNKAQMKKLEQNGHKERFDDLDTFESYYLMMKETKELQAEIYKMVSDYKAMRHEFADIANFCHMGILACDKELSK